MHRKRMGYSVGFEGFGQECADNSVPRRLVCAVERLLAELSDDDRREVQKAMDRVELTSPAIRKALIRRLFDTHDAAHIPSAWTLSRHRRKECRCE